MTAPHPAPSDAAKGLGLDPTNARDWPRIDAAVREGVRIAKLGSEAFRAALITPEGEK